MADKVDIGGEGRPPRGESPPRAQRAARASGGTRGGAPPRPSGEGAAAPKLSPDDRKLREAIMGVYVTVGMGGQAISTMRGDIPMVAASANIIANAEAAADAWIALARQNPRVRAALQGFVQGSEVAAILSVHVTMAVPFLAARGVVPPGVAQMMTHPDAIATAQEVFRQQSEARAQGSPNGNGQ